PEIAFGAVGCGAPATTRTFDVANVGAGPLVVTAATTGAGFTVSPSLLRIAPGADAALTVTAAAPGSATAGQSLQGSLDLFTDDPANTNVAVPLSAIASGATLAFPAGAP